MIKILLKLLLIGMFTLMPSTLIAVDYDTVVTGANSSDTDPAAAQKAADQGGSVLLRGTFDFGEEGTVKISKDTSFNGETDAMGRPRTTIKGGNKIFQSQMPTQMPPQSPGPKVDVRNIHFQGASDVVVSLPYCGGAEITNNKITDLKPVPAVVFGKKGMFRQQAFVFVGFTILPTGMPKYQPGAITGTIMVADNDMDLSNEAPEKTMAQGVFILCTTGANIQILRNRISTCSRNSIESLDNYRGTDGTGMIIIQGNRITTAEEGLPLPGPATPNGIVVGWFLDRSGMSDPTKLSKIVVTENEIKTRGDSSIGIIALADRAIITSNSIKLKGGPDAIGVSNGASDTVISNNSMEGSGSCAFNLKGSPNTKPCRNTVVGNDLRRFKATKADIFLGGSCNFVMQDNGTIQDEGKTNLVMR